MQRKGATIKSITRTTKKGCLRKRRRPIKKTWRKVALIAWHALRPLTISGAKSTARSKTFYDKDLPKSREHSAACNKASYDRDPNSGAKSTARSKASYDKDLPKSREHSAVRNKASYDRDPNSGAKSTARSKASS